MVVMGIHRPRVRTVSMPRIRVFHLVNKKVRTGEYRPHAPLRRMRERVKKQPNKEDKTTVAADEPYRFLFGTNRVHLLHLNKVMWHQIFFDASILSCYVRVQCKTW